MTLWVGRERWGRGSCDCWLNNMKLVLSSREKFLRLVESSFLDCYDGNV